MRRNPLIPIFLIVFVDILGLTIILPLLPFYAERFGATPFVIGLLVSAYAVCQLISGPVLGRISDRMGRKPLLLVSQAGTLIGFFILAWASSLWMVFLSRIIDGATAGNISLAQAYISDITKPEERAKSFGVIGIAFGIGFLIGPGISGFLSQFGYQVPILAAAGLSATSILATTFLLPSGHAHPPGSSDAAGDAEASASRLGMLDWKHYRLYFQRPVLAQLLWEFFLFAVTFSIFISGFALFAERRYTWNGQPFGPKEVGYVFAYLGFLGILMQGGALGRLVKRFGERRLITAGFASILLSYTLLGFTYTLTQLLLVSTISSFGNGVLRPALASLISQQAGRREQGIVLGLTQSLMSIAQIIGPIFAGALIERGLLTTWSFLSAGVAGAALVLNLGQRSAVEPGVLPDSSARVGRESS
jgi:DHA1 family tetracycline resistance protein-like MFS transporter